METTTVRVSTEMQSEVARIAALRGVTAGELLTEAWDEFLQSHKDSLAEDLEEVAEILRSGTTHDLAKFLSRDVSARAAEAAKKARA